MDEEYKSAKKEPFDSLQRCVNRLSIESGKETSIPINEEISHV